MEMLLKVTKSTRNWKRLLVLLIKSHVQYYTPFTEKVTFNTVDDFFFHPNSTVVNNAGVLQCQILITWGRNSRGTFFIFLPGMRRSKMST